MTSSTMSSNKARAPRYRSLRRLCGFPIAPDCDVVVERGAVIRSNEKSQDYLQFKLRNCGTRTLRTLMVEGCLLNETRTPLPGTEFSVTIEDAGCAPGGYCATRNIVPIRTMPAFFLITRLSVLYADDTRADYTGSAAYSFSEIRDYRIPAAYTRYIAEAGKVMVMPHRYREDLYLCSCGTMVYGTEGRCEICGKTFEEACRETTLEGLELARRHSGAARRNFKAQSDGETQRVDFAQYGEKIRDAGEKARDNMAPVLEKTQKQGAKATASLLNWMRTSPWFFPAVRLLCAALVLNFLARAQENGISDSWGYFVARGVILCLAMVWGPLAGAVFGALSSPLHSVLVYGTYSPAKMLCGLITGLLGGWIARYMELRRLSGKPQLLYAAVSSVITAAVSTLVDSYLAVAMSSAVDLTARYGLGGYLASVGKNLGQDMGVALQLVLRNGPLSVLLTTLAAVLFFFLVEDCFPRLFMAPQDDAEPAAETAAQD